MDTRLVRVNQSWSAGIDDWFVVQMVLANKGEGILDGGFSFEFKMRRRSMRAKFARQCPCPARFILRGENQHSIFAKFVES